ncbi:uncharacterized protein EV420DRAFT_1038669 [Desarmillaria tabescens]|uniref:Uncharacterized protein n=1 Tax=Armillaria tabescens TaxID=1929756 RepID=A0AA39NEX2_ARMTA|nr:uncharacterized protein EV420DRAFT_1038669 [Desarmillaria tabescens]KAK0464372.1 hypothetical protein EV420DRAFT_1038669 [Desarmillaria tabescens]
MLLDHGFLVITPCLLGCCRHLFNVVYCFSSSTSSDYARWNVRLKTAGWSGLAEGHRTESNAKSRASGLFQIVSYAVAPKSFNGHNPSFILYQVQNVPLYPPGMREIRHSWIYTELRKHVCFIGDTPGVFSINSSIIHVFPTLSG